MVDETSPKNRFPTMPSESMPSYYVDYTTNCSSTKEITKLTFTRTMFDTVDSDVSYNQPTVQLVMSNSAFLNLYAFMSANVEVLLESGVYTREQVDNAMKNLDYTNVL